MVGEFVWDLRAEAAAESPEFAGSNRSRCWGRMMKRYDHEEYGGALLLGVQGTFLKVHGSGGARAIKNAVRRGEDRRGGWT